MQENMEQHVPDFLVLPYEVLADRRLTLRHLRVLMALFSWRRKDADLARVSRQMLSERTGYPAARISAITTELEALGWIEKSGHGGKSQWVAYRFRRLPESGEQNPSQSGKGIQKGDAQNGNDTVSESVRGGVTESVRGIDTERNYIKHTKRNIKRTGQKSSSSAFAIDRPMDVSEQVWQDFIQLRRAKRAPVTQTAINRLRQEAQKANLALEEALKICLARGWQGFSASWLLKERPAQPDRHSGFDRRDYAKGATKEDPWWVKEAGA